MEWFSKDLWNAEMMNPERIKLYYDLMRVGIGLKSVRLFPGRAKSFYRINGPCFTLETTCGRYALWVVSKEEPQLLVEMELLRILNEKGISGFLYPIRLKNNCFYDVLEDGRLFYLTDWPELRRISFRHDINSLLTLSINFRKVMSSSKLSILKVNTPSKYLIEKYQDMIKSIKSFVMLASFRLHPTIFDRIFLEHWKGIIREAEFALELIRSSKYSNMIDMKESLRPIINDFSRSNLRALFNGQAICISLKGSVIDIPLIDLALLMVKTGRANRWSRDWYEKIIEAYNESFPLTNEDLEIIRAYIAFPWELYRLVARYYHNRVNWPIRVFVEKIERILERNKERRKLLKVM